jgi:hypothetical protein
MATLADTTFATGADESLATVDTYNVEDNSTQTAVPNIEDFTNSKAAKDFVPDKKAIENLKIIKGADASGLKIDQKALSEGILASSSGVMGAFKGLPNSVQSALSKTKGFNKIKVTLDGTDKYVKMANMSTMTNLATMIKGVSGCDFPISLQDQNGTALLGGNLIKQASGLGIPGGYDAFIRCLNNKYISDQITRDMIPYVVSSSNVDLMKQVANGPEASNIKTYAPSFVGDFTNKFSLPSGTNETEHKTILDDCFSCFNKITPDWNKLGDSFNLSSLKNASPDFKKLLSSGKANASISIPDNIDANNFDTSTQYTDRDYTCGLMSISEEASANNINLFASSNELLMDDFSYLPDDTYFI